MNMYYRGRRLRATPALREMMRETLRPADLVMPYFVQETADKKLRQPIASMPGQYRYSLEELERAVAADVGLGLRSCLLFGIPAVKNREGTNAYSADGIVQQAVRRLKTAFPD